MMHALKSMSIKAFKYDFVMRYARACDCLPFPLQVRPGNTLYPCKGSMYESRESQENILILDDHRAITQSYQSN